MEELKNVEKTVRAGLCVSCGVCRAVCPVGAIEMEMKNGQFVPKVNNEKCTKCGLCLEVCPGIDIDPEGLRTKEEPDFSGRVIDVYTGHSRDADVRRNSASGGIITSLVEALLGDSYERAFVLPFEKWEGREIKLREIKKWTEVRKAAKSKYIPASVEDVAVAIRKSPKTRSIVVGTPCQIRGIKKFMRASRLSEDNLLFLGLFCDRVLNTRIFEYFEKRYGKGEKIRRFLFKDKEGSGWPGDVKIELESGRDVKVDKGVRRRLKPFFQLNRCLFCLDKLNRDADISFGDCYIKGEEEFLGRSNIIVRSAKGKRVFEKYKHLFVLEKEEIGAVERSQHIEEKAENLEYCRVLLDGDMRGAKRLKKRQRMLKLGAMGRFGIIDLTIWARGLRKRLRAVEAGIMLLYGIMRGVFVRGKGGRENILVIGGHTFNKGAEAMTFAVVEQLRKRFPEKRIIVCSSKDYGKYGDGKHRYKFEFIPWDTSVKLSLLGPREGSGETRRIKEILKNASFFVDIHGYSLTSQFGPKVSIGYVMDIIVARRFGIPYYILPQSIGPFEYPILWKVLLYPLLWIYLKYPRLVFVREKAGIRRIGKFTKGNTKLAHDIVLQYPRPERGSVYLEGREVRGRDTPKIVKGAVGIIPNKRVLDREGGKVYRAYKGAIGALLKRGRVVYIVQYSHEDREMCEEIKGMFGKNPRVRVVWRGPDSIELEEIIGRFDFVIASRYHSLVHAYKNGIPAVVVGWAEKYQELMEEFEQTKYFIECGKEVEELEERVREMEMKWREEKRRIARRMQGLDEDVIGEISKFENGH